MEQRIIEELKRIEEQHGVKVLYAVESGAAHGDFRQATATTMYGFSMCRKRMVLFDRTA